MSIPIGIRELPRGGDGQGFSQEYQRRFEVQFADGLATAAEAHSASGIIIGDPHPENLWATAYRSKPTQRDDVCFWDLVVEYKTFGLTYSDEEKFTVADPLQRKPIVKVSWATSRVPVTHDTDNDRIVNAAGHMPEQPFESDAPFLVFQIRANVAEPPEWIDTYRNRYGGAINDEEFRIMFQNGTFYRIARGDAQISGVSLSEIQKENGIDFFIVEFTLTKKDPPISDPEQDGWCFDMLDMGRMERLPDKVATAWKQSSPYRSISGSDGQAVSEPTFLTKSGLAVPPVREAWTSGTEYVESEVQSVADGVAEAQLYGDVVSHNDKKYYCLQTHTASGANEPPNDTFWEEVPHVLYWNYLPRKKFADVLPACVPVPPA